MEIDLKFPEKLIKIKLLITQKDHKNCDSVNYCVKEILHRYFFVHSIINNYYSIAFLNLILILFKSKLILFSTE